MTLHPFTRFRFDQKPPWSQAGLARELGVTRSYVNRVEAGIRRVGINKLAVASRITGLPMSLLRPDLKVILKRKRPKAVIK